MNLSEIILDADRLFIGDEIPRDYLNEKQTKAKNLHALAYPLTKGEVVDLMHYAK